MVGGAFPGRISCVHRRVPLSCHHHVIGAVSNERLCVAFTDMIKPCLGRARSIGRAAFRRYDSPTLAQPARKPSAIAGGRLRWWLSIAGASSLLACNAASAAAWNAHYQATYIEQHKNAFDAAYSGPNSLSTDGENSYSFTATAFWGVRLWQDGELYLNPEVTRGMPLSDLTGLGGFTNGEMARTSGPDFKLYRARLLLRQTWNLGGDEQAIDDAPNQLATRVHTRRLLFTLGNVSMLDLFDDNQYAHDGRTQFFNWALITYGAFDFAADARGYTWAATAEWYRDNWVLRIGRGLLPQEPNGERLDTRVLDHYGDQLELERRYAVGGRSGAFHVLAYHDRAVMARYDDALNLAAATNAMPDINAVRNREQSKYGVGVSLEQAVTDNSGLFLRAMWADGHTETEAYTTIDRSIAAGFVTHGASWRRAGDSVGVAYARNLLSHDARRYFEAGGLGFFIGDGRMRYGAEQLLEAYYDWRVIPGWWLTADVQRIANPAYNRDRGPVLLPALRLHAEF